MLDTLHIGIPRRSDYTKTFVKVMSKLSPEAERKAIKKGREYSQVIDLRYFDVPGLLHIANVYDSDAEDKFEFIGAGDMGLSQWVGYIREVFLTDVEECRVMRMDTTADLHGAYVPWCRENVRVAGKQSVQYESPMRSIREVSRQCFETAYWGGRKRGQYKAYDKTGELRAKLLNKRRKMTRAERESIGLEDHFLLEYGYSIFEPRTRFERQITGSESAKLYAIEKFGSIQKAVFINPFERMEFPEDAHLRNPGRIPRGLDGFSILYLRDLVRRDGITNARNEMMRTWGKDRFYRRYNLILPLILPDSVGPTKEEVRKTYVESTMKQFAA